MVDQADYVILSQTEDEDSGSEFETPEIEPQTESCWERTKKLWSKETLSAMLSYDTQKEVAILDRRLGLMFLGFFIAISLYILIFVFLIQRQYLDVEKAEGDVVVSLHGKAISEDESYVWDVVEENPWGKETNAVFVPSKVMITRKQSYGACGSYHLACNTDDDCDSHMLPNYLSADKCLEMSDGFKGCEVWQWCPAESTASSETHYLAGPGHQNIWIRSDVTFKTLVYTTLGNIDDTSMELYPGEESNTYELGDLLTMIGANYTDVAEKGAILHVNTVRQCTTDPIEKCDQHIEVDRLDEISSNGFSLEYASYYREDNILYRDYYHYFGIRILCSSTGLYTAPSIQKTVLQLASAVGMLLAAKAITDGIMLNMMNERAHYKMLKIKESKDFNVD